MKDTCGCTDQVVASLGHGRGPQDTMRYRGHVLAELRGSDGTLKQREETHNLVTDVGDNYFASRIYSAATLWTYRMKTGTTATAVAKNGAGSFVSAGTYNAHSAAAMEATYPKVGASANIAQFQCVWPADADHVYTVRRASLVDNATDAGEADATKTAAIALFGADIVKAATDTLTVTWTITFLGA